MPTVTVRDPVDEVQVRANRLDIVGRLADDLAHEIKNPLNAVVINLALLKRRVETGDAEAAVERADVIEEETARVHGLVDQVLRLVRPERESGTYTHCGRVVADLLPLLELQAKVTRITLVTDLELESAVVSISSAGLRQVLLNLFDNAVEALRSTGGRLVFSGRVEEDDVILIVEDDGPGVAPELRDELGARGRSGWPGRAGIGLAVAATLVNSAKGRIEHERLDDEATVFRVVLPRSA